MVIIYIIRQFVCCSCEIIFNVNFDFMYFNIALH